MLQWWVLKTLLGKVPLLIKLLLSVILTMVMAGGIVHLIEPSHFVYWFDGIWWAIVTIATVGYGDYAPESIWGRLIGMVLMFVGVGLMTLLVSTVATTAFSRNQSSQYGELAFLGENHVIIIGWNERTKHTIENIIHVQPHTPIVLIDETLTEAPDGYKRLHFVRGNSSEDAVLKQANIGLASSVLITAKHQGSEFTADARTILTTLSVKSHNPDVYTIAEILTREQLGNARRAGADECIESTTLTGAVLVTSLLYHHMSDVLDDLLKFDQPNQLSFHLAPMTYIGCPFSQVMRESYEKDMLLIGMKRSEQVLLHPPGSTLIQEQDELVVIERKSLNKST